MPIPTHGVHHNATLLTSAARTANGNNQTKTQIDQIGWGRFSSAVFMLNCTAVSGSSPTLNVRIQVLLPDDSTWADLVSFGQLTGVANRVWSFVNTGNAQHTPTNGTLAAGGQRTLHLGEELAVHWTVGGSSPSFTFAIYADAFE